MKENFNPNRNVSIPHICPRTGNGMAVDAEKGTNYVQKVIAGAMVMECEYEEKCPEDCPIRVILKEDE